MSRKNRFGVPIGAPVRSSRERAPIVAILVVLLPFGPLVLSAAAQPTTNATPAQVFELQVRGPDGKPVPEVAVGIRIDPPLRLGKQITRGTVARMGGYQTDVKADADGRVALEFPPNPTRFIVSIVQPGYGPYWAEWSSAEHPERIPASFSAELEGGWTVGGVIVDSRGNPIEGAKVHPSIDFKKRPGDHDQLGIGKELTSDAKGIWGFPSVPDSMRDVHVAINHADFKPERRLLSRSEFGVESGREPAGKIVLTRGIMVIGRVTDEAGKPITGALVRTKFSNEVRQATTGDDGTYFLAGCEPRMTRLVVTAPGRAMELQTVRVEPNMQPVDFMLRPGGRIRVRVLDEKDQPIPGTRIFFQQWRGHIDYFEFDHVNEYTDANGVWEWNEAPLDEFKADICRPGGMQLLEEPLVAREEEYIFHPPLALVVTGKVIDASTKEPIKKFRVVPGERWSDSRVFWSDREGYDGVDGEYRIKRNRGHIAHLVRVEADGYQRAQSREIKSDEGNVTIDFELEPGKNINVTVMAPDGAPAAGAKAALGVAGSQINIDNCAIDDGSTYATRLEIGETGQLSFPQPDEPYQLVIAHPAGFAYLKSSDGAIPETLKLTPWARVEGVFKIASQPVSGVTLNINTDAIHSYGQGDPNIFTTHETTTGADGSFVFERVMPGKGRIGRRILLMVDDGATEVTSSKMAPVELRAGETTRIELGGDGRPVIGKLAPPAGHGEKVLWNFAIIHASIRLAELKSPPAPADTQNDRERYRAWWNEWQATDEGKAWQMAAEENRRLRETSPSFSASIAPDGSFRIDDMPAGEYRLSVRFNQHPAGQLMNYGFSVPAAEGGDSSKPVDLGVLTLEQVQQR